MNFIYGKQDWKTFERGEENCFLMTNGLGGFSSLTMIGSCGRNDHAVLMACVHSSGQWSSLSLRPSPSKSTGDSPRRQSSSG